MANKFAQQQSVQTEKHKKKSSKKRILAAAGAVVLLLTATILTLSFVYAKPVNALKIKSENVAEIVVYKASGSASYLYADGRYSGLIDEMSNMKFSIMRGILEGKVKTGIIANIEHNNEDDETEVTNPVLKADINALNSSASEANYMVEIWLKQDAKQTVEAGDKKITYNRIIFFVPEGENEITKNRVYLYDNTAIDGEDFETYETYFHANMYSLRAFLETMFENEK